MHASLNFTRQISFTYVCNRKMESEARAIDLARNGKTVSMKQKQITASALGMIFLLNPETVWLQCSVNNKIYLSMANSGGRFVELETDNTASVYGVEVNGVSLSSAASPLSPAPGPSSTVTVSASS